MAASATYEPIETKILSSNQAEIDFNSIPQTYTDLVLVYSGTTTGNDAIILRYNNDANQNYNRVFMYGVGNGMSNSRDNGFGIFTTSLTSDGQTIFNIQNYSNTSTYKTAIIYNDFISNAVVRTAGVWRSTAAILSVNLRLFSYSFTTGSTFTLYGIAAA